MIRQVLAGLICLITLPGSSDDALKEVVQAALASDPRIDEARYGYEAALSSRGDALSYRLPKLNAIGGLAWTDNEALTTSGALQRDGRRAWAGVEIVQPLFSFGRNDARKDMSVAEIGEALENVRAVRQGVALETISAWFDLYRAEKTLEALDRHASDLEALFKATEEQQAQDLLTTTDVALVNSRWQQAIARREQAGADVLVARNALWKLTGREGLSALGTTTGTPPANMPMTLDEAVAANEATNPATGMAEMAVEMARARTRLASGERFGELALSGSWNKGRIRDTTTGERQVGLQLSMPLYDGGRTSSKIRRAKREESQARSRLDHQRKEAERQVREAWSTLQTARKVGENWQLALSAEEKSLAGIQARVDEQLDPLLVLLEARDEMIGVRLEAIRSEAQREVSSYRLLSAMGSLLAGFEM